MNRDYGRRGPSMDNRGMGGSLGQGLLGPAPSMMNTNMGMDQRQRMMNNFGGSQGMANNNMMGQRNMNTMQMQNMGTAALGTQMGYNMANNMQANNMQSNNMQSGQASIGTAMRGSMPGPSEQLAMAINLLKGGQSAPSQPMLNMQGGYNRNTGRNNTSISQLGKRSMGYDRRTDIKRLRNTKPIIDPRRNFGRGDYQQRTRRSPDRDSYSSRKEGRYNRDRHHSDDRRYSGSEENAYSDDSAEEDLKDSALTVTVRSDERGRSVNEGPHDAEKEKAAANETKKNFCYACNAQCRSEENFMVHLSGKRHKMTMEQLSILTEQKCHELTGRLQIEKQLRKIDGRGQNRTKRIPSLFPRRDNSNSSNRSSSTVQRAKPSNKEPAKRSGDMKEVKEHVMDHTKESEDFTSPETSAALIDLSEYDVPPYDADIPQGMTYVIPVSGFFCKLCHKFYNNEAAAKEAHCSTRDHYDRFKKVMELKQMRLKEKQASLIAQAVEAADVFMAEDEKDYDSDAEDAKESRATSPSIGNHDEESGDEEDEAQMDEMIIQDEADGIDDDDIEKDEFDLLG